MTRVGEGRLQALVLPTEPVVAPRVTPEPAVEDSFSLDGQSRLPTTSGNGVKLSSLLADRGQALPSRREAQALLATTRPLKASAIREHLAEGATALAQANAIDTKGDPRSLAHAYLALLKAETIICAAFDEASRTGDKSLLADARQMLREVGLGYDLRRPEYSHAIYGDQEWKAQTETHDGQTFYVNTFKSKTPLSLAAREAKYTKYLNEYLAAGGGLDQIHTLSAEALAGLKVGERYEYVVLPNGCVRFALVPKDTEKKGPGHTILAEGDAHFKDVRALSAGEFWVYRDQDGALSAFNVSCGSGHFKPSMQALAAMETALGSMGLTPDHVVFYGGPASARDVGPKLLAKLGASKLEIQDLLPERAPILRLRWHQLL